MYVISPKWSVLSRLSIFGLDSLLRPVMCPRSKLIHYLSLANTGKFEQFTVLSKVYIDISDSSDHIDSKLSLHCFIKKLSYL